MDEPLNDEVTCDGDESMQLETEKTTESRPTDNTGRIEHMEKTSSGQKGKSYKSTVLRSLMMKSDPSELTPHSVIESQFDLPEPTQTMKYDSDFVVKQEITTDTNSMKSLTMNLTRCDAKLSHNTVKVLDSDVNSHKKRRDHTSESDTTIDHVNFDTDTEVTELLETYIATMEFPVKEEFPVKMEFPVQKEFPVKKEFPNEPQTLSELGVIVECNEDVKIEPGSDEIQSTASDTDHVTGADKGLNQPTANVPKKKRGKPHPKGTVHRCPTCPYQTKRYQRIKEHIRFHSDERPFKCEFLGCGYASKRPQTLAYHTKHLHSKPTKKSKECPECKQRFKWRIYMMRHINSEHPDVSSQYSMEQSQNRKKYPKGIMHQCPTCPYQTERYWLMKDHIKFHSDERSFKCDVQGCGYASKRPQTLAYHMKHSHSKPSIKSDKTFECPECKQRFKWRIYMMRHINSEHPDVSSQYSLKQSDKGKKYPKGLMHKCPTCPYQTERYWIMKEHIKFHSDERSFKCEVPGCGYASKRPQTLQYHIKNSHSKPNKNNDKVFECPECKQSFKWRRYMIWHINSEHPEISSHYPMIKQSQKGDISTEETQDSTNTDHLKTPRTEPDARSGAEQQSTTSKDMKGCTILEFLRKNQPAATGNKHANPHSGRSTMLYQCEMCSYNTTLSASLKSHVKLHSTDGLFVCQHITCGYKASNEQDLESHMITHGKSNDVECNVTEIECPVCEQKFLNCNSLRRHLSTKHPNMYSGISTLKKKDGTYHCAICSYRSSNLRCFTEHLNSHLYKLDKMFKCSALGCTYAARRLMDLDKHIKGHKTVKKPKVMTHKARKYPECEKRFINPKIVKNHVKHCEVTSKRRYTHHFPSTCPKCGDVMSTPTAITSHFQSHHKGEEICCKAPGCEYIAETIKNYENHRQKHHTTTANVNSYTSGRSTLSGTTSTIVTDNDPPSMLPDDNSSKVDTALDNSTTAFPESAETLKNSPTPSDTNEIIKCPKCEFTCYKTSSMRLHIRRDHSEDPMVCPRIKVNGTYKCTKCSHESSSFDCVRKHYGKHFTKRVFVCSKQGCGFTAKILETLKQHQYTHTTKARVMPDSFATPMKCPLCDNTFSRMRYLSIHIRSEHDQYETDSQFKDMNINKNTGLYECSKCKFTTKISSGFQKHLYVHRTDFPYKCTKPNCQYAGKSFISLFKHLKRHTSIPEWDPDSKDASESCGKSVVDESPGKHIVDESRGKHIVDESVGKSKVHAETPGSEYMIDVLKKCPDCDYVAKRRNDVSAHFRKVHPESKMESDPVTKSIIPENSEWDAVKEEWKCTKCEYCVKRTCDMTVHQQRWHGAVCNQRKKHMCAMCGGFFRGLQELKNHMTIHTGEKLFQCDQCSYRCRVKSFLTRHLKKHGGEKMHKCPHCSYSTFKKPHLSTHLRIHSDMKPYICPHCDYACKHNHALKSHITRRHHVKLCYVQTINPSLFPNP